MKDTIKHCSQCNKKLYKGKTKRVEHYLCGRHFCLSCFDKLKKCPFCYPYKVKKENL